MYVVSCGQTPFHRERMGLGHGQTWRKEMVWDMVIEWLVAKEFNQLCNPLIVLPDSVIINPQALIQLIQ